MSQDNNTKVLGFTLIMTIVSSLIIAFLVVYLKPIHKANEEVFNKRAILSSIESSLDKKVEEYSPEEITSLFDNSIKQFIVSVDGTAKQDPTAFSIDMKKEYEKPVNDRMLPLFIYEKKGVKTFIASVRGKGLWDAIWGNIAFESDLATITGVSFDHVGETPGLGAEIKDNPTFGAAFKGKKIYSPSGEFKGVTVTKTPDKSEAEAYHDIDAISGATVTSVGVSDMMKDGLMFYLPYFNKMK